MRFKTALLLLLLFYPAFARLEWWDSDWDYRSCVEVNSTDYEREYWPVEYTVNLTKEFQASGGSGQINATSLRLIEQDTSSGSSLWEVPHQLDRGTGFSTATNFQGTLVWILNGTTAAQDVRTYCLYYDNDTKPAPAYTNMSYSWDGEEFQINVSIRDDDAGSTKGLQYWVDTSRGANVSGIYRMRDNSDNEFWSTPAEDELPVEFMQYSNATHNFTFDLQNDLTVLHHGPSRTVVEQQGPEVFWNSTIQTEGQLTKRYTFYNQSQWIRVEQVYNNTAAYSITRNSTPAGALAFNVRYAEMDWINFGNGTEPGSWWWFASEFANDHVGIINVNDSGPFLSVNRNSTAGRGGIELNDTTLDAGSTLYEMAALHFNSQEQIRGWATDAQVKGLRNRLLNPEETNLTLSEKWDVQTEASTDHADYNRGENVTLLLNATVDSGLIVLVNATLESPDGSETFPLYDDGTHGDAQADDDLYTNYLLINESNSTGQWNLTTYSWDKGNLLLDTSNHSFQVRDAYTARLTVGNDFGYVNRTVRATLQLTNYRDDTYVPGAEVNCTYDSTYPELNVTDHANGTYSINFTSPSYYGEFTLTCNATKLENTGTDQAPFTSIEYTTSITTYMDYADPSGVDNVTLDVGQDWVMLANITNLGNGTGFDINFSLSQPTGWTLNSTFEQVGQLNLSWFRELFFEVGVPANETPGTYPLNATLDWRNADGSFGQANRTFNVTVQENPWLRVPETNLTITATPGEWNNMGNFTVLSRGNFLLQNVTFNVTGLPTMSFNFTPPNITSIAPGSNRTVAVWVFMPLEHQRGTFSGTLNASAFGGTNDTLNLTVSIMETFMNVTSDVDYFTSNETRWFEFQNFTFTINATNIGYSMASDTNITIELNESYWTTNYTGDVARCGDVSVDGYCAKAFELGVMRSTPGNYTVIANVSWMNPGVGMTYNTTNFTVVVEEFVEMQVDESEVEGQAPHGRSTVIGNFTLRNSGNAQVEGVDYTVVGLPDFNITLEPSVSFIPVGSVIEMDVNVSVPLGYAAGIHTGDLDMTSSNDGLQTLALNITVPVSREWTMSPQQCQELTPYPTGTVCEVRVENNGNYPFNLTISPESANYTYVNVTNFTLANQEFRNFTVHWNLTGMPRDFYNATYNVSVQGGQPPWRPLNISLIPSELPNVTLNVSTNVTQELEDVVLYANITDHSQQGLDYVRLRALLPDGTNETQPMNLVEQDNHTYLYTIDYPGGWGSGDQPGYYELRVEVRDNLGLQNRDNESVYFYPLMQVLAETGFDTYFAGESASLFLNVTDVTGHYLQSNLTARITGPDGFLRYEQNFSTTGFLEPIPTFTTPSDAPLGGYNLTVESVHRDTTANATVRGNTTHTFQVRENYQVEFETAITWYPDSLMKFYLLAYTDREFQDPDRLNLTVYDPDDEVYFSTETFEVLEATNQSRIYLYDQTLSQDAPVGLYLAEFTMEQGGRQIRKLKTFRISYGGPYDVVISDITPEVEQGGDQQFQLLLENMGDFSQDVFIDYWIQSSSNTTYDEVLGEAIYVPAGGNRTLNRSLAVYSDQPVGNYTLHAKLNYSPFKPPIEVSRTFRVVSPTAEEEEPVEPLEPVEAAVIEMTIINLFPEQTMMNRGSVSYLTVEVENTGNVALNDLTVFFDDFDRDWYEVVRDVEQLAPGASGYLVVKFDVPSGAAARTYVTKLKLLSKETEMSEFYKVIVFKTQEAALRARIASLREELLDLEDQTGSVAARGGDVTKVLSLLRKSRELLDVAETYLEEDSTVEAIKTISEVESIVEEIKYRLEISRPEFIPHITVPSVPTNWYVIIASLLALVLIAVFVVRKFDLIGGRRKKAISKLKSAIGRSRERGETSEVLDTLKGQYKEGMISRETFEELKGIIK